MVTLQQTDNAADCGAITACSGGTLLAATATSEATEGGTAGSTEQTVDIDAGQTGIGFFVQSSGGLGSETWFSGTYTAGLEITTGSTDINLVGLYLCRIDSGCTSLATVGSDTSISQTMSAGTYSFNVSGTEQNASLSDDLYVVYEFQNTAQHGGTVTIGVTPSQTIDTPNLSGVSVSTSPATSVTDTSATLNGSLDSFTSSDGDAEVWFEWGQQGAGFPNTTATQTLTSAQSYSDTISGLNDDTTYEFRAAGSVVDGDTDTGATETFTTQVTLVQIGGHCTIDGADTDVPVIHVVRSDTDEVVATTTPDVNGDWTADVPQGNTYHAAASYDDGSRQENIESLPFINAT